MVTFFDAVLTSSEKEHEQLHKQSPKQKASCWHLAHLAVLTPRRRSNFAYVQSYQDIQMSREKLGSASWSLCRRYWSSGSYWRFCNIAMSKSPERWALTQSTLPFSTEGTTPRQKVVCQLVSPRQKRDEDGPAGTNAAACG
jgi:hypothetical protein